LSIVSRAVLGIDGSAVYMLPADWYVATELIVLQ